MKNLYKRIISLAVLSVIATSMLAGVVVSVVTFKPIHNGEINTPEIDGGGDDILPPSDEDTGSDGANGEDTDNDDASDGGSGSGNQTPDDDTSQPEPPQPEPPQEETPIIVKAKYLQSKTDSLNIRSGAGSGYSSLGYIDKGDRITYLDYTNGWYKTYYRNQIGYVSSAYVDIIEMNKGSDIVEKVIEQGIKLLGSPYVYGAVRYHDGYGNKLNNFDSRYYDCSSLTQYMYYKGASVNLNTTTRTQIKQGSYVSSKNIQRGDLMFFTNSTRYDNVGIERVGHVAVYLGDNYILHTASDYAVIEEISAQRWGYYIETRRIVW